MRSQSINRSSVVFDNNRYQLVEIHKEKRCNFDKNRFPIEISYSQSLIYRLLLVTTTRCCLFAFFTYSISENHSMLLKKRKTIIYRNKFLFVLIFDFSAVHNNRRSCGATDTSFAIRLPFHTAP